MLSVYVETSVFGAYVEMRDDVVSRYQHVETLRWWRHRRRYQLFCSEAVIEELSRAPFPGQVRAVKLARSLRPLTLSDEIAGIATIYRKRLLMPDEEVGDALHLAVASFHEMDALLTWNCTHLANANKTERIVAVNSELRLMTPRIVTPPMM